MVSEVKLRSPWSSYGTGVVGRGLSSKKAGSIGDRAHRIALVKETHEYELLEQSRGLAPREPLTLQIADWNFGKFTWPFGPLIVRFGPSRCRH